MTQGAKNRGAALIIAIAILAILMAIALSFYTTSRVEFRTSGNVLYGQKAEHLANGGLANALAFLNHDVQLHSTYTSIYHAWRTYWNGASFAGKPWAWYQAQPGLVAPDPLTEGNVPEIWIDTIAVRDAYVNGEEKIHRALTALRDNIYIPRIDNNSASGTPYDPMLDRIVDPPVAADFVFTDDHNPDYDYQFDDLLLDYGWAVPRVPVPSPPYPSPNRPLSATLLMSEQVHSWTDVDNDGDGLNDSMWYPIPQERYFMTDGIDNDLDGLVDEGPNMHQDGIDNDLDGTVDEVGEGYEGYDNDLDNPILEANNLDDDGDGTTDELGEGIDEPDLNLNIVLDDDGDGVIDEPDEGIHDANERDAQRAAREIVHEPELGLFVYYGGDDGLDNDRDGQIDELDEQETGSGDPRLFLTCPLVDQDGNAFGATLDVDYQGTTVTLNPARFSPDVDALDNDYSIVVNDGMGYAYAVDTATYVTAAEQLDFLRTQDKFEVHRINKDRYFPASTAMVLSSSGEPICDVVGRMAILITDEASKVNLNSGDGLVFNDTLDPSAGEAGVTRAFGDGVTPREFEFRTIPDMGTNYPSYLWDLRTGLFDGVGLTMGGNAPPVDSYAYDMNFPGYGRVDDDGDALALMYNGLDDDGDATLYDQYNANGLDDDLDGVTDEPGEWLGQDGIDNDLDGVVDEPMEAVGWGIDEGLQGYDLDGDGFEDIVPWPEGVDDPEELRRFSPFRHLLAEFDDLDNDDLGANGVLDAGEIPAVDEIGEMGDRRFRTRDQVKLVTGIGPDKLIEWRNVITAHSIEKNERRQVYDPAGNAVRRSRPSGTKLHYNYARARSIGDALIEDWDYRNLVGTGSLAGQYAMGLRQEPLMLTGTFYGDFAADPILRAYQLGASVQDGHDRDHARTEVTTDVEDEWWDDVGSVTERRPIRSTVAGVESIRINELMVRAVRRVEAETITDFSTLWDGGANPEAVRYPTRADDPLDPAYLADGWRQYDPNWVSSVTVTDPLSPPDKILVSDFDLDVKTLNPGLVFDAGIEIPRVVNPARWEPFAVDDALLGRKNVMSWHRVAELGDPLGPCYAIPMGAIANVAAASQLYRVPSHVWIDVDDNPNVTLDPDAHLPTVDPVSGEDVPNVELFKAPNLVQYRFGPSPGLPPGRYYLLAGTKDENGVPSVPLGEDYRLNYALKYGPIDPAGAADYADDTQAGSILRDVQNGWVNLTGTEDWVDAAAAPQKIPYGVPIVGVTEDGAEATGLVMLSSTGAPLDTSAYPTALQGYYQDYANTVVIPPYNPADQQYLYVAVWRGATPAGFIEDHEDGIDNDNDGLFDENPFMHTDGVDNDDDGVIDEADENPFTDGVDNDNDGLIDAADPDENPARNTDGVDNDSDGDIDEFGEGFAYGYESAPLCVNFFDFSQEPDHEWVEIVNVAEVQPNVPLEEQVIDLSGWQLEIRGDAANVGRIVATIPADTFITPGGSLLLGFDKDVDVGAENFFDAVAMADYPDVFRNGMGLASDIRLDVNLAADPLPTFPVGYDPATHGALPISEPAMPNYDPYRDADEDGIIDDLNGDGNSDILWPGLPLGYSAATDILAPGPLPADEIVGASVFFRPVDRDLVDRDGNGQDDFYNDLDGDGNPDGEPFDNTFDSTTGGAFDRIVQLETPVLADIRDLPTMAQWVLRGGIFPNYPEHDGLDNDADNPVLIADGVDNNGSCELFDALYGADGVDNDIDGSTDEANEGFEMGDEGEGSAGFDTDGDGFADFFPRPDGVDEGRPEAWVGGIGPGYFARDSVLYTVDFDGPGGAVPTSIDPAAGDAYLGTDTDAPEWKAFVERKFFPGDCVVVTLYEGFAETGRVADRVTYTERDVINRSLQDVLPDLYTDTDGDGVPNTDLDADGLIDAPNPGDGFDPCPYVAYTDADADGVYETEAPTTLDDRYPSMWPNDTMGLDFYRSVERKHPLYHGDLIGTQNRWESTDGNYDDWAAGMGAAGIPVYYEFENRIPLPRFWLDRFDLDAILPYPANAPPNGLGTIEYGHAIHGSPLRSNIFQRATEQSASYEFLSPLSDGGIVWAYDLAGVRNRNYISPGDVATMPHMAMEKALYRYDGDLDAAYLGAAGDDLVIDLMVGTTISGIPRTYTGSTMDLASLVSSGSHDEIVLTCAQADFYPITPTFTEAVGDASLVTWNLGTAFPAAWSPFFLFELDDAAAGPPYTTPIYMQAYPVDLNLFLFNQPGTANGYPLPPGLVVAPPAVDELRDRWPLFGNAFGPDVPPAPIPPASWPITGRAAMYISSNPDNFDLDTQSHGSPTYDVAGGNFPAEALFIWEVEDGVENGEYDVFIAVAEDLSPLSGSPLLTDSGGTTADGVSLVDAAALTLVHEMVVDAEVLADQDGDGRIWLDLDGDRLPQNGELHRGVGGAPQESFGLLPGLTPDTDGLVYYGTINVRHNNVALFLRNWAKPGVLNRFSRVILTPRQRTEGRINVNTASTRWVEYGAGNFAPFNPTMGLPGMLWQWNLNTGVFGHVFDDTDNIGPGDLDGSNAGTPFDPSAPVSSTYTPVLGARAIANERPQWWDGRYYRYPSDLISVMDRRATSPLDLATTNYNAPLLPEDQAPPAENFREIVARYTRLGNLITTRSDVFEIIVTAQSGYAYDEDGDGHINFRSDNEFIVNGEKKIRTIYERREPEKW